ncbi:MAG: hypothetical protein KQI35_14280 [Bacteroidetes bacterium]|nr:hypothetical protein [Bacteroidota bacterium]
MNRLCFLLCAIILPYLGAAQEYGQGLIFDDTPEMYLPMSAPLVKGDLNLPSAFTIEQYCPTPGSQGKTGTCTAWALAYNARTIIAARQMGLNGASVNDIIFSPSYIFEQIKRPDDYNCMIGTQIKEGMNTMKNKGVPLLVDLPFACGASINENVNQKASQYRIGGHKMLFTFNTTPESKIEDVRMAIANQKPVIIGFNTPKSFKKSGVVWERDATDDPNTDYPGHAMVIVAYDDNKYGGAVKVINSWGTEWGENGFVWIKYQDFAAFCREAYEIIEIPGSSPPMPVPVPQPDNPVTHHPSNKNIVLSGDLKFQLVSGGSMMTEKVKNSNVIAGNEYLTAYQMSTAYPSNTEFRYYISNYGPAYLYAIATDLSGEIHKIFPHKDNICPYLGYAKNTIAIPSETGRIQMDKTPGTDFLCILYSPKEININKLIATLSGMSGSLSSRLEKAIGDELLKANDVTYDPYKVGFEARINTSLSNKIVPLMVAIEHK